MKDLEAGVHMRDGQGRRALWVIMATVAAIGLVAATWLVASRFQSPAQREAAASPPAAEPVVVAVTRGDLVETTTTKATAQAEGTHTLTVPLSQDSTSVVTREGVTAGATLTSGAAALWVNNRPVIALRGAFPLFRDLGEGDTGDDVRMLQRALSDLGCSLSADGTFGARTSACVRTLYTQVGASAPTRTTGDASATPTSASTSSAADTATGTPPTGAPQASTTQTETVYLPMREFLFTADLPVQVVSAPPVGTTLDSDSAVIRVAGTGISLSATVPGTVAATLSESTTGQAAMGDTTVAVRVQSITAASTDGAQEDTSGSSGSDNSTLVLIPTEGTFPQAWAGHSDVLVTIDLSEPVTDALQVPQRAIAADASGSSSVLVRTDDGTFTQVTVDTVACVAGMCALADGSTLAEGDEVRVDR